MVLCSLCLGQASTYLICSAAGTQPAAMALQMIKRWYACASGVSLVPGTPESGFLFCFVYWVVLQRRPQRDWISDCHHHSYPLCNIPPVLFLLSLPGYRVQDQTNHVLGRTFFWTFLLLLDPLILAASPGGQLERDATILERRWPDLGFS